MANSIERITMVLVDTSAFVDANSDFIGVHSALLPSFFNAVASKEIILLTHPILEKEIQKHIEDSSIYKNYQQLVTHLGKCKDALVLAGCNDTELFEKIAGFDIKAKTFEIFKNNYSNAVMLEYPEPDIIFEQYFSAKPPFAIHGKKKNEFPDAFVIESAKQYLEEHYNEALLVVSRDSDWKDAFDDTDNVLFSDSISDAIKRINEIESVLSDEMIKALFQSVYEELLKDVQFHAECECYDVLAFEFVKDFEVDRIKVDSVDDYCIIPLKITRSSLLIKTTARVVVDGHGVIFNEDESIWINEEDDYIYKVYSDMSLIGGEAEVECEIEIQFDFDDLVGSAWVSSVKFNNGFSIEVEGGYISLTDISEEDCYFKCR
ncbi:MAG: DUF4935 domain-containing protein [Phascolarctobacterium sp.]|nr:DUF4935 domain-containing protein [Phascolarctobacterium sp.]